MQRFQAAFDLSLALIKREVGRGRERFKTGLGHLQKLLIIFGEGFHADSGESLREFVLGVGQQLTLFGKIRLAAAQFAFQSRGMFSGGGEFTRGSRRLISRCRKILLCLGGLLCLILMKLLRERELGLKLAGAGAGAAFGP